MNFKNIAKSLLWKITRNKNTVTRQLNRAAKSYTRAYTEFTYDPEKNGEEELMAALGNVGFRRIFDVGANIGDWTKRAMAKFPEAEFHCFELSAQTFRTLEENLRSNRCHLNNFGLAEKNGEVSYLDYGNDSELNTLLPDMTYHGKDKPATPSMALIRTGEDYCKELEITSIDFLKIDVEGAERLVLEGFTKLLGSKAIRCVQFEYGFTSGDVHFLMKDFFKLFESHGYLVGKIWKSGVDFRPFTYELNQFRSGPNFFAALKTDIALIDAVRKQ